MILREGVLLHPLSEGGMSTWTAWRGMVEGVPVFPAWRRGALEKTLKKVAGKFGREGRKCLSLHPLSPLKKGRGSRRSKNSSLRYWKVRKTSSNRGASGMPRKRAAGRRDRKKTNEIHTMKSLILAQDER